MLEIKGLSKSFDGTEVLKDISLQVDKGDVMTIIGPSGTGKTTLLRCMNFLERADAGIMRFQDAEIRLKTVTKKEISRFRRHTGFVFQNYNLFLNKTALQNVTEGLLARKISKEKAEKAGREALDRVGLSDKCACYPAQLSGGQQQRVAIARTLAADPDIIFFDEPTSALDPELTEEVLTVMRKMADEGMTMVVVTHEMGFARHVSNKVVFMENGKIVESASAKKFFENPAEERSKEFIRMVG